MKMKRAVALPIAMLVMAGWMTWPDRAQTHVTTTNTVLFDREVVNVIETHCAGCHAPGSLARSLVTYEETWLARESVLAEVLARHMPPWAAVPGYGEFANDNSLTLRETQFLISWVEGLGPRNAGAVFLNVRDAGDVPAAIQARADFDNWALGEPDRRVALEETVIEPGQGERIERRVVDLGLTSESWVRGLEFKPGDRRVVRAAAFSVEATGQWLGNWTPWHGYLDLPDGVAYRLPPGSRVTAEIHYRPSTEQVSDQGVLGLFFAEDASEGANVPSDLVLEVRGEVAVGREATRFSTEAAIDADSRVLSLWPRFEPGIQSLEVAVRKPDGGTEILLFARDIPFNWPTPYILAEPVLVEAGSELRATAYYSNETGTARPGGVRLTVSYY